MSATYSQTGLPEIVQVQGRSSLRWGLVGLHFHQIKTTRSLHVQVPLRRWKLNCSSSSDPAAAVSYSTFPFSCDSDPTRHVYFGAPDNMHTTRRNLRTSRHSSFRMHKPRLHASFKIEIRWQCLPHPLHKTKLALPVEAATSNLAPCNEDNLKEQNRLNLPLLLAVRWDRQPLLR